MANYNGQFQDSSANVLLGTPHSYANIEGATASQAYVKGQMIVYQNRLCEVTAAIASGANLVIGTNIAYKNVGDIGKQLVANDGTGFYFDVLDGKYGYYPSASKVPAEFVPFGGTIPTDIEYITRMYASTPINVIKGDYYVISINCDTTSYGTIINGNETISWQGRSPMVLQNPFVVKANSTQLSYTANEGLFVYLFHCV